MMLLTFLAKMTDSEDLDKGHCHAVAALRRLLWQKREISDSVGCPGGNSPAGQCRRGS
ncbi:hypothetical protein LNO13_16285 [Klebsiella variicola subsp. variicola]|nr:hypothetical protein [Klebsiella variicola subsp. variicola]